MESLSIEELMLELSFDGERKDKNTILFYAPDGKTSTELFLDEHFSVIILTTKLHHRFNDIEGTIFTLSEELFTTFSEDAAREIIEDIATQIKYVYLPNLYKDLKRFELKEIMDHESVFFYQIDYKDKSYEEIKRTVYDGIEYSFRLISDLQEQITIFIEKNIKNFLEKPDMELKVLEIKKRLFQVQFYSSMTGRFSDEQKRKAKRAYQEAIDLYEKFKREFPEDYKTRKELIDTLFSKFKQ